MDFYTDPSHRTYAAASNEHEIYPPTSQYMSRSSHQSSSSSFVKKPALMSDESLSEPPPPPLKATAEKQSDLAKRWATNVRLPLYSYYFFETSLTCHQLLPNSWPIRLFLATVVLETIIDLAVQADIYTRISSIPLVGQNNQSSARRVILYLSLFAFAQSVPCSSLWFYLTFYSVFQLLLAIEAVWQQNTLQFLFLT
jgi:hypothetical protein